MSLFLVILKCTHQKCYKIMKKCFLSTTCIFKPHNSVLSVAKWLKLKVERTRVPHVTTRVTLLKRSFILILISPLAFISIVLPWATKHDLWPNIIDLNNEFIVVYYFNNDDVIIQQYTFNMSIIGFFSWEKNQSGSIFKI